MNSQICENSYFAYKKIQIEQPSDKKNKDGSIKADPKKSYEKIPIEITLKNFLIVR